MRPHEPDESLMAEVAQDQRAALEILVRRYASRLLTLIQRMIGNRHRSEELVQEVLLQVWRKRAQYEYPRPFRGWLYTIALRRCWADFRSPRVTLDPSPEMHITTEEVSPLETMINGEQAQLVAEAVARLPAQQRSVVVLRVWEDLPYSQIAEVLALSEGTVRSHMHHALASLRRYLQPQVD